MPKVLISDKMSPKAAEIFRQRGIDVDEKVGLSPEELKAIIGDYDGLAVRSATKVKADILAAASRLKVIGRAGIGVDNIDVAEATNRGVVVMNTPFGNSITTAEHAISMMMAVARQIPTANESTHAGKWEKSKFMGVELYGKTLGIIGCGNIGSIVADRAQGLKMHVLAYDPFLSPERAERLGVTKVELDELFPKADFISLHTPLTESTRNIVDAKAFAAMKDGVRIVNCARGGLIDEAALKEALDSGKVAGAGLDVFAEEPAKENALFGHPNLVVTPHLGAATEEAQVNVAIQVAEQLSDYLLTGGITNALNMPSVSAEEAPRLKPYMALAKQLGGLAGQIAASSLKAISIEYEGAVTELNRKPLTQVVLEGLLRPSLDTVNMVNAPAIAKERGIEVSEVVHDREGDYQTLMRLTVTTENHTRTVAGTLFADRTPRIVEMNGTGLEAELAPFMLYVVNNDKPGFIGSLGTVLGDADLNIGTFNLGRTPEEGTALALVSVDAPLTPGLLREVEALQNVREVKALTF